MVHDTLPILQQLSILFDNMLLYTVQDTNAVLWIQRLIIYLNILQEYATAFVSVLLCDLGFSKTTCLGNLDGNQYDF